MILLGAIVLETFMVYPNIFQDPPGPLKSAWSSCPSEPRAIFPSPRLSLLDNWHRSPDLGLAREVGPLLDPVQLGHDCVRRPGFDGVFLAPEEIMFIEGSAVHSAEFLRQTAQEFQTLHWSRLAFNAVASVSIFVGFLKFYRHGILSHVAAHRA
jgi:hypothetical protein